MVIGAFAAAQRPMKLVLEGELSDREAALDEELDRLQADIGRAEVRTAEVEAAIDGYKDFDRTLGWLFPGAIAAGFGAGYLLNSALPVVAGLVVAAGSHFVRVASSVVAGQHYSDLKRVREEIHGLAVRAEEATREKQQLREELKEKFSMLDSLTGDLAGRLGITEHEETILVGDFELTRRWD